MIYGDLNQNREYDFLPSVLKRALDYLRQTDFSTLENQKHIIDGDDFFVNIAEYETKPSSEKNAEKHEKFIDIHFLISGTEAVGIAFQNPANVEHSAYDEQKDCRLFKTVMEESTVILNQKSFLICFPEDIHRPSMQINRPEHVRKAVVKINVNLLSF